MIPIANYQIRAVYLSEIRRGMKTPQKPKTDVEKIKTKLFRYWREKQRRQAETTAA
jgi:hypothetical protein